ncbi:MAG: hypothetical protein K2O10_04025 [Muribaculaceae bacterium]|nr:hypothetical protein [Muribaculaceae bacterium]
MLASLKLKSVAVAVGMSAAMMPVAVSAQKTIDGYFRIQPMAGEAGDNQYVEVRGPFTAVPDQAYADARYKAGTVFYINAVADDTKGYETYVIKHLRSQGIDAVGDPIDADNYWEEFVNAVTSNSSPLWGLVNGGFQHGYVSIGRAAIGAVLTVVASRLEQEGDNTTLVIDADELKKVAEDFNRNVTANLDLDIRLLPVQGEELGYQLFFDVPSLDIVSKWYTDESTPEAAARKASFEKGMAAMSKYTQSRGLNFEYFTAAQVKELESLGYRIADKYTLDADGGFTTDFPTIFADPDLLFNWLKMVMMTFTDPNRAPDVTILGYNLKDLAAQLQNHYLTSVLVSYLPRLHTGSRYFLISGRVYGDSGDVTTPGTHHVATGNLGFANTSEVAIAGNYGKWHIKPIDNDQMSFSMKHRAVEKTKTQDFFYEGLYLDFPVKAKHPDKLELYTLREVPDPVNVRDYEVYYTELVKVDGTVPALTSFLCKSTSGELDDNVLVIDYANTLPQETPGGFVVGDDVVAEQRSLRRVSEAAEENTYFRGVLLSTPITSDDMAKMWGIDYNETTKPIYRMKSYEASGGQRSSLYFMKNTETADANEAFIMPSKPRTDNRVLVSDGEPIADDVITGIENVVAPADQTPDTFYDLRGVRVESPVSGQIYILNGRKVLVH